MEQTASHPSILNNQKGFTLIELIIVIVLLGILAVVAIPKYTDLKTEAAVAAANGVYGAAQGAAAINFAAGLVGKAAANRPAYDVTHCTDGVIVSTTVAGNVGGNCLLNALDGIPQGWSASGATITTTVNGVAYTITVGTSESTTAKAVLSKNF